MSPTPKRRRGPLIAAAVLAATLAPALASAPAGAATPYAKAAAPCGPMDVTIVLDTTGSMGGALSGVQSGISTILADVVSLSGGDYKLGLVSFKDNVTVNVNLAAGNQAAVSSALASLTASGGSAEPEASDEALNTVVNNLPATGRPQTGNFSGTWRTNATKHAIMVTDARPGGFDNVHSAADVANAHSVALDAQTEGIKITPIYVPTNSTYTSTIMPIMQDYANTTGGFAYQSNQRGTDVAAYIQRALYNCTPTDVFIRDNTADAGVEPLTTGSAYTSPDIRVCTTSAPCAGTNPIAGQTNFVFVRLNNPGPGGSGTGVGTLKLYYTAQGGGAQWPLHWTQFGAQSGITVPPGGTTVMIPWHNVPGPGHFCLLARWESATDPMTFAETTATHQNARNNNNIAWRNINSVRALPGAGTIKRPFTLGNPFREALVTDLVVAAGDRVFDGRLTIDLGPELTRRWKEAGGKAEGLRQVGETQFDVVDLKAAAFRGLALQGAERQQIELAFTGGDRAAEGQVIRVFQADQRGEDLGGVEFLITDE
ncbi:VWA domain-containing protein [Actinokineospora guangxiensis]|uniref:VWA domain-containing protein n=1 Tax=Actinokineospora guangxiensis TaxID=1490288 RepID=A0ABW0EVN3_9PSEU